MSWSHFGELRALVHRKDGPDWIQVARLMAEDGGDKDEAACAYMHGVIEALPIHKRPCRIALRDEGDKDFLYKLADPLMSEPSNMPLRCASSFTRFAIAPLYGGHFTDFSQHDLTMPFYYAQLRAAQTLLMRALAVPKRFVALSAVSEQREAMLTALKADLKLPKPEMLFASYDSPSCLGGPADTAEVFCNMIEDVVWRRRWSKDGSVGRWVARHRQAAEFMPKTADEPPAIRFERCCQLLASLHIPIELGQLYGVGLAKGSDPIRRIKPGEWFVSISVGWELLFKQGRLLEAIYAYCTNMETGDVGKGYPMPSAHPGGSTQWISIVPSIKAPAPQAAPVGATSSSVMPRGGC